MRNYTLTVPTLTAEQLAAVTPALTAVGAVGWTASVDAAMLPRQPRVTYRTAPQSKKKKLGKTKTKIKIKTKAWPMSLNEAMLKLFTSSPEREITAPEIRKYLKKHGFKSTPHTALTNLYKAYPNLGVHKIGTSVWQFSPAGAPAPHAS